MTSARCPVGHFVALLVAVQANAGAELAQLVAIRIEAGLMPVLNGRRLIPMLLLFDPLTKYVGA